MEPALRVGFAGEMSTELSTWYCTFTTITLRCGLFFDSNYGSNSTWLDSTRHVLTSPQIIQSARWAVCDLTNSGLVCHRIVGLAYLTVSSALSLYRWRVNCTIMETVSSVHSYAETNGNSADMTVNQLADQSPHRQQFSHAEWAFTPSFLSNSLVSWLVHALSSTGMWIV